MSEREQSPGAGTQSGADWRQQTSPGIPVAGSSPASGSGYARPAAGPTWPDAGYGAVGGGGATAPVYSTTPVTVRRADSFAGLLLVLAGIAAAVTLLLRWLPGSDLFGWELVRRGLDDAQRGGAAELFDTGSWQPLAVTLGGGVLFVLGLLVVLPARTHRFLGVLALLVSLVAAAGVLVPFADTGWDTTAFGTGFWFAVAVPALGLLGALKAMLTTPRYGTR
ncbi:hypothetical protein DQ238_13730 [Geodermatophilus sp. TF02-6]|uniref:hypothetical protein n=1 Tax=Geodermatophilus sp. TF02-6 TaxID=2250575 RepID=UPI000DEB801E|nr:hypothetical protein [Geodermatophilus sp. TF02-6]RBY77730.1 hypothetical protein DQ238_13730 [Geodermatophilus sp. TF02-6]